MILLGGLALVAAELPAPAKPPAYSIREVWQYHQVLDGQVIRVRGIVTKCQDLGCSLREHGGMDARTLAIGTSADFDRRIQSRLGAVVTVEARFDPTCLHDRADKQFGHGGSGEILVCTDRASMLIDPRIVSNR
ncbi:hypothetical protein [Sphingomonas sp. LHG3406-1]|uniref:hypothetical protein n=1 Tax=Sphingomonas sp. LHG3406-1 TaxID=2804617 RepID=UPI00261A148E|nr:hypothetical protein [Sphingomonas sp. LHG3406-1]